MGIMTNLRLANSDFANFVVCDDQVLRPQTSSPQNTHTESQSRPTKLTFESEVIETSVKRR